MSTTDVLVVGAGPTGLTAALELSLQNISYRIINAAPIRSDKSRAMVMHPRSLELLDRHGIAHQFASHGSTVFGNRIYVNRKFVFEMNLNDTPLRDTAFGCPLIISQAETEAVLDEALKEKYGVQVEMGVKAEKVVQDEDGVTTHLRKPDGSEEILQSRYIIGCDGAHSIVRKSTDITFEGSVYPQDFILADLHLDWELSESPFVQMCMGTGFAGLFRMKGGLYRLVCTRPQKANDDSEPTLQDFQEVVDLLVPGKSVVRDPIWMTRFRLHHRLASSYSKGRVFLAGDSAHIHSPAGGQGMNTGIQDAVNLAWKLALVLNGKRQTSFLNTYNEERRKVGEHLLKRTDKFFEFMATTNPIFLWLRNTLIPWIAPWALRDPETRRGRFRFISQLAIRYRHSSIVGTQSSWTGEIRGGDRAPDGKLWVDDKESSILTLCREPRYHLLLFSAAQHLDALEARAKMFEADEEVEIHVISKSDKGKGIVDRDGVMHARYGFSEAGYVLLRPDGHVGFIGGIDTIDDLEAWWRQHKGIKEGGDP